ncbi:hypothetical protein Vadar_021577 [Vaccinium darrowii]|uniref:Uncharacterized protein n=1 Tax=Vaccinium darrowii TaxID=229202 RepID=A0ACB7ZCW2_9ERIC|nr:hypothetical protein Vadar_021577 [Vaccinium darrowii]
MTAHNESALLQNLYLYDILQFFINQGISITNSNTNDLSHLTSFYSKILVRSSNGEKLHSHTNNRHSRRLLRCFFLVRLHVRQRIFSQGARRLDRQSSTGKFRSKLSSAYLNLFYAGALVKVDSIK